MKTPSIYKVPRRRIELPTPAFSGPRSTTELPRLNLFVGESSEALPSTALLKGVGGELPRLKFTLNVV